MSPDSPPEPFEGDTVDAVAAEHGVDAARLRSIVTAHQDLMARLPGVENLVYEWRKQFDATVLVRTEDAYFVDAPEWAWEEFADSLDANGDEMAALAAVHARTASSRDAVDPESIEGATPIVLGRR